MTSEVGWSRERAAGGPGLGGWVRRMRDGQGMSQRALADRAGLSRSYLCDIERGRGTRPSVPTLDKLAAALGASRTDLLRAAGVLEAGGGEGREREAERRLLAVFRDLSEEGRAAVERFARFTHREEHAWVQPALLDDESIADQAARRATVPAGPTLFDDLDAVRAEDVEA